MSEANMNNRFDFCANGKVVYKGTQFTEYEDVEDAEEVVNPYGDLWGTVSGAVAQIVNVHPFMQTLVHNIQYIGLELMNSILMALPIALTLNDPAAMAGRGTVVLTGSRAIGAGALLAIGASKVQIIDPNIVFAERGGGSSGGKGGGPKNPTTKEGAGKAASVDDILKGVNESTNGKGVARNFDKSGGFEQALKDFKSMDLDHATVKEIQTQYGLGKVGKLKDGTTVVVRPGSNTGGSTLEIRISNTKVYKIRY